MTQGGQLDANRVHALFNELSDRLTRDVDALFVPASEVRQIAEE